MNEYVIHARRSNGTRLFEQVNGDSVGDAISNFYAIYRHDDYKILGVYVNCFK